MVPGEKRPTEIWTEARARDAHDAKTLYTALIESIESPFCFREITNGFVGVGFLDEQLRESLYYHFREISPGRLFLQAATYREFDGQTDKVTVGTTYNFRNDGIVKIQKQSFNLRVLETSDISADITQNYSTWPEFGEYEDLIRVERGFA